MNKESTTELKKSSKKKKKSSGIKAYAWFFSILFMLIGASISLYFSNQDQIKNPENYNIVLSQDQVRREHWIEEGDTFISGEEPWIFLDDIDSTVTKVILTGRFSESFEEVKFYYTTSDSSAFDESKSKDVKPKQKESQLVIPINESVESIRIDLTTFSGITWEDAGEVTINPSSLQIQIQTLALALLLGFASSIPFYYDRSAYERALLYTKNGKNYTYLLHNLVKRDITTKYRRSVLGVMWSVLNPLLMMLVITMVFQHVFRSDIDNFPIYYLTGALIFNFVVEATNGAMTSILGAAPLIKKVYIPKYIFPLEKCLFALINMLFSLIAVVIIMLQQQFVPSWTILLFPIPILYTFVFCVGLGLILASLNVFFRDISHLWGVFTTAWMYLTPIIYPLDALPEWVKQIVKLNPLYYYVDYFRQIVMYGTIPNFTTNAVCIVLSSIFLIFGIVIFKKTQDKFILYI